MVTLDDAGRDAPTPIRSGIGPELRPFVEHAWVQPRCTSARADATRRVLPDASAHVVVVVSDGGEVRGSLVGGRSSFCDVETTRRLTVGVRLRPGVLPLLTGLPAWELVDRGAPLVDVFPDAERVLEEAWAGRASRALGLVMEGLVRRLRGCPAPDGRVRALERSWAEEGDHGPGVASSARRLGVGVRTLRQVSAEHVGLSPSRWRRIARVHGAIRRALGHPGQRLSSLAAASGYHDQAHMARDFRDLVGEPPSRFLGRDPRRSVQGGGTVGR